MKQHSKHKDVLTLLNKYEGNYRGIGRTLEEKKFNGRLSIKSVVKNCGILMHYTALSIRSDNSMKSSSLYTIESAINNEEHNVIALDNENNLKMWSLNSSHGTMITFDFRSMKYIPRQKHVIIFGFGEIENNTIFREEITIELWDNGEISYKYTWGEPNGAFLTHSSVTMRKI